MPEIYFWAAQCIPENQTATASPARLALSHSLTPVWCFLSFPDRNLCHSSVFSYPCLGFHNCICPNEDPGRTKNFSSFLLFQDLLWRDLWKRDLETCLLEQWLFQHARLRECAAEFRQMLLFPDCTATFLPAPTAFYARWHVITAKKLRSSSCVSGYPETDPLASQDEGTCQHNLPLSARARVGTETIWQEGLWWLCWLRNLVAIRQYQTCPMSRCTEGIKA